MPKRRAPEGQKKATGRPPTGPDGERSSEFPHQISTRVPGDTFHRLDALAGVTGRPYWQILGDAVALYIKHEIPASERALIDANVKARFARCETWGCNQSNRGAWKAKPKRLQ